MSIRSNLIPAPLICSLLAAAAQAAPVMPPVAAAPAAEVLPQVAVSAPAAWVLPIAPPAKVGQGGAVIRLLDVQVRADLSGIHTFQHSRLLFNNPASLQLGTNLAVAWQPSQSKVTINAARIIRAGQPIDLLAAGKFTSVRQEAQLAAFQIDGNITAYMPVTDLRVGDELEFAYTIDTLHPALGGHRELEFFSVPGTHFDRLNLSESHLRGDTVRTRVGSALPPPRKVEAGGVVTTAAQADDFTLPKLPAGAPPRLIDRGTMVISDYASWGQLAAVMRPLFERGATLTLHSPIQTQIDTIAAAHADPLGRANAALALVQHNVRYFAELQGLGGYVPISADAVWQRKIGDCKGKTVLLLAMLRGLGIEAEPMLVSTQRGDGADTGLPMLGRFDHVLVHARIAGQDHWLDGTRMDSGRIEELESPPFLWGLPLGPGPGDLTAIPSGNYRKPQSEWRLTLDASAGLDRPVNASGQGILRGDAGQLLSQALQVMSPAQIDESLRAAWTARRRDLTVTSVSHEVDPVTGEVRIGFIGTTQIDWNRTGKTPTYRYEIDGSGLGYNLVADHSAVPPADTPIVVDRQYSLASQTVLLPDNGKGFTFDGGDLDETIGGVHYRRRATLTGNRAEMTVTQQSPRLELTVAQALAADSATDGLISRVLAIRLPAATAALEAGGNVDAANSQIMDLVETGNLPQARAQIEARLVAAPRDAKLLALRGLIEFGAGALVPAQRDLDAALAISPHDPVALKTKARLLLERGQFDDALVLFDRAVLMSPDDDPLYTWRSLTREAAGDLEGALADRTIMAEKFPDQAWPRYAQVRLLQQLGRPNDALAIARASLGLAKDKAEAQWVLVGVLMRQGKAAQARAETFALGTAAPDAGSAMIRLNYGLSGKPEQLLADALLVVKQDPAQDLPEPALAALAQDKPRLARLIAAYDAAAKAPGAAADRIAVQRGLALRAGGNPAPLLDALNAAEALRPGDAQTRNQACWDRAIWKLDLVAARASCTAALAPARLGMYVDSLAMVELQADNYGLAEALYAEALRGLPESSATLYGRGLARLRSGNKPGGEADLALARKLDPEIDARFARYGLRP